MIEREYDVYVMPPVNGVYQVYSDLTAETISKIPGVLWAHPITGPIVEFRYDRRYNGHDIVEEIRRLAAENVKPETDPSSLSILGYLPSRCPACGEHFFWGPGDEDDFFAGLTQNCKTCESSFMYIDGERIMEFARTQPGDAEKQWRQAWNTSQE